MNEFIKDWIISILVLTLLMVLIEILLPSERVRKFVRMVAGLILIIAVINPLIAFSGREIDLKDFQLTDSYFIDRKEIEKNSRLLEKEQFAQMIEVYRKKIIRRLEDVASEVAGTGTAKADVMINEDSASESFGEIIRVYIYLSAENQEKEIKPVSKVEKIKIGGQAGQEKTDRGMGGADIDEDVRKKIAKKIHDLFGVKEENIVISAMTE